MIRIGFTLLLLLMPAAAQAQQDVPLCRGQFNFSGSGDFSANIRATQGQACRISLSGNNNTWESMRLVRNPTGGSAQVRGTRTFIYTPRAGFTGQDALSVAIVYMQGMSRHNARLNFSIAVR